MLRDARWGKHQVFENLKSTLLKNPSADCFKRVFYFRVKESPLSLVESKILHVLS